MNKEKVLGKIEEAVALIGDEEFLETKKDCNNCSFDMLFENLTGLVRLALYKRNPGVKSYNLETGEFELNDKSKILHE